MCQIVIGVSLLGVCFLVSCCVGISPEAEFHFSHYDADEQEARFRELPMDQQYRTFLFGTQQMHPPILELGRVFAEHGKAALDYALKELERSANVMDFVDSMVIFEEMQRKGYYPICEDPFAMGQLRVNLEKVRAMTEILLDNYERDLRWIEEQCDEP